jgi:hypothetical protein
MRFQSFIMLMTVQPSPRRRAPDRRRSRPYASRQRFLTDLSLDPLDATSDEAGSPLLDEVYLILSTIHSAKGQEWQAVYVLNVADGCIPSDMASGSIARGRAATALCRHDARQGRAAPARPAPVLLAPAGQVRRFATCMPPAAASFLDRSCITSMFGPAARLVTTVVAPLWPQATAMWMCAPGCARCGASASALARRAVASTSPREGSS